MNIVYILKCKDGTYYTGWTNDLKKRIKAHNEGKGAKYTKARRPVELVYFEKYSDQSEARQRECAIKKLTRIQKQRLIKGEKIQTKEREEKLYKNLEKNRFAVTICYRKRKTLSIHIKSSQQIRILSPYGVSKINIESIIEKKKNWILKKSEMLKRQEEKNMQKSFENGSLFLHLGKEYPLSIIDRDQKKDRVMLEHDKLKIVIGKDHSIENILKKWYKQECLQKIVDRIEYYQPFFNIEPTKVQVKEQKKRWGSCSSKRHLMFNWRIIMAPLEVMDYIVVHEMCHMIHMNHSREYWQCVEAILPDYKKRRDWLKENGLLLTL